jgi:Ca2+-binding EF-hand superfamily protein
VNGDGVISKTELVAGALALAEEEQADVLQKFDTNKDGSVTTAEALALFQNGEQEQVTQILDEFDANEDGEVTSAEISAVHPLRGGRVGPVGGGPGGLHGGHH